MATRAQDQPLVSDVSDEIGLGFPSDVVNDKDIDSLSLLKQLENSWENESKIVPAFGWHPWFSYQMYDASKYSNATELSDDQKVTHYQDVLIPPPSDRDFMLSLPDPQPFTTFLTQTKKYLSRHPLALVGEIGLDKGFRLPHVWSPEGETERDDALTPGGREGRQLSRHRISMPHQRYLLSAQLNLAGEMGRAVSVHGVQIHGILFETLAGTWKGFEREVISKREMKKREEARRRDADVGGDGDQVEERREGPRPYPPRICLHSYSGSVDQARQYLDKSIPAEIFFSFSEVINFDKPTSIERAEAVIKMLPDTMILVESDLHTAGERMDGYLEDIVRRVCKLKGWGLEDGVKQLGRNWKRYVFGREELG